MKDKIYNGMQTFSKSIIQPIMFMSISGIFISVSALLRLESMPSFLNGIGEFFFNVIKSSTIANLSVIFCVGIASAMAKKKKTDAAVMGISSFLIFLYANNYWLRITDTLAEPGIKGLAGTGQAIVLGVQVTDMGVFSGIVIGCMVGIFLNKRGHIKFHKFFAGFEGSKFAYLLLIFAVCVFSIGITYVWPFVNSLVTGLVDIITSMGSLGFGVYGFANRMLIPFGLHHLLWMPLYYTPLGGSAVIAGETVYGAMNIWLAELGNIGSITAMSPSIGYLANFGYTALPIAIALALVKTAKPENKEKVKSIVIPAVLAAVLGGITEPIEFVFLFTSPFLWIIHSLIYGFGLVLSNVMGLNIMVENLINTIMYSLALPVSLGRQYLIPVIFVILLALEYFSFVFFIKKFNIKTIGREDYDAEGAAEIVKTGSATATEAFTYIVDGLGGKENIDTITNCITRLRIAVKDETLIKEESLKLYPAMGVFVKGNHIQIIIGREVPDVRHNLEDFIKQIPNGV